MHRHLRGILRRVGLGRSERPDPQSWQALLREMDQAFRTMDEERFRLQRSLEFHHQETEELYRDLLLQREQLLSLASVADQALVLLDARGRILQMNPKAGALLGLSDETEGSNLFELVDLESIVGGKELGSLLHDHRTLSARGRVHRHDGQILAAELRLHPLVGEGELVGAVLALSAFPVEAAPRERVRQLQQLGRSGELLLQCDLSPELESCARAIVAETERALDLLRPTELRRSRIEETIEELSP